MADGGSELVLSASSMSVYLECPLAWYFTYILAERGETSLKKVIGIAVHDAVEGILKHLVDGTAGPMPDPASLYQASFEREYALGPVKLAKDEKVEAGRASGLAALRAYIEVLVTPDDVPEISHVEAPFEIEVNGIPYSGTIDRIDTLADLGSPEPVHKLRDTKTTNSRPRRGRYRLNMIGYALGHEIITGRRPDLIVLDYIVRTKEPYYWPEYIDPPSDVDVADFAFQLADVAEGIDASRFPPLGLDGPFTCAGCPHQLICGPYQRVHATT